MLLILARSYLFNSVKPDIGELFKENINFYNIGIISHKKII